ncbi:hypothetical protein JG688_00018712 [Phytophthora aleatoria]|uniref:Uncharacterized protein n=1 Tax=Phytophthora aleatoria TaxID=2496075 RepID=A0A8J5MAX2_9STRA|nr:hypothetical protein JG688_00018712 [Phytophthora aleatoria]
MCFILHSSCPASLTLRSTTCDWASQAWGAVTPETIRNCWKHSGKNYVNVNASHSQLATSLD